MGQSYTIRGGKSVPTDEAFDAWTSGDLGRMLRALDVKTNPVDRHFLLLGIAEQTFKRRSDPSMARDCARISDLHLAEFPQLAPALKSEFNGVFPRVPTFQNYSSLLVEKGQFDKAIEVCQSALRYGLHDGTQSGFQGRIARIRRKQAEARA